jgi:NADH-quinone oxidoreductase subunit N
MACAVALVDLYVTVRAPPTHLLADPGSLVAVAAMHLAYYQSGATAYGMQGMVVSDPMGHLLAFFATVAVIITMAYAQPYIASREMLKGEFFSLTMFVLLGICVMCSATTSWWSTSAWR